jgi:hypothetical protein
MLKATLKKTRKRNHESMVKYLECLAAQAAESSVYSVLILRYDVLHKCSHSDIKMRAIHSVVRNSIQDKWHKQMY